MPGATLFGHQSEPVHQTTLPILLRESHIGMDTECPCDRISKQTGPILRLSGKMGMWATCCHQARASTRKQHTGGNRQSSLSHPSHLNLTNSSGLLWFFRKDNTRVGLLEGSIPFQTKAQGLGHLSFPNLTNQAGTLRWLRCPVSRSACGQEKGPAIGGTSVSIGFQMARTIWWTPRPLTRRQSNPHLFWFSASLSAMFWTGLPICQTT